MNKEEVKVEPMNILFAKVMEIMTIIGLAIMVIPGIIYSTGVSQFVDVNSTIQEWDKPASRFWEAVAGIKISGYSWFMSNLTFMDCLSIIGIAILALAPLVSLLIAASKAERNYKIIFGVLIIEFVIAIIRPLFVGVVGH